MAVTERPATGAAGWLDRAFWGEVLFLALALPVFYLPGRFPAWGPIAGLGLLLAGWGWRRRQLGCWWVRLPVDWPLLLLLLLLPMAVWVAPADLRAIYSYPRSLIVIWNMALFCVIAVHSGRTAAMRTLLAGGFVVFGAAIAAAALFGTRWQTKFPVLSEILPRLPQYFIGVFAGAQEGFSPNQVAGTLLYVLPFTLAWLFYAVRHRNRRGSVLLALAALLLLGVLVATQSRAGLAGLAVAAAILLLMPYRWGRWLLGLSILAVPAALWLLPTAALLTIADSSTRATVVDNGGSIVSRVEIWLRAAQMLRDFPLTGVGLGAFRGIVQQVYPMALSSPDYDIAHAHNFFLQSGLDFGLLGLVAVVAIYLLALVEIARIWRTPWFAGHRAWAIGLLAALGGQAVYSLADVVAMGSKTNLLFWWLLGLIFGVAAARRGPGS